MVVASTRLLLLLTINIIIGMIHCYHPAFFYATTTTCLENSNEPSYIMLCLIRLEEVYTASTRYVCAVC